MTMCAACRGMESLKITWMGSTSTTLPSEPRVKPDGAFIQAFAAITDTLPRIPARTTGTPVQNCAHREGDGHVLRPSLGQHQRVPVVMPQRAVVGDQGHEGPRDPERHQDDVEGEGERHLRPSPRDRVDRGDHHGTTEHRVHVAILVPVPGWVWSPIALILALSPRRNWAPAGAQGSARPARLEAQPSPSARTRGTRFLASRSEASALIR